MVHGPLPLGIFMCEGEKQFGKVREPWYELVIKVAESDKRSDPLYVSRVVPIFNGFEFGGVHFYGPRRDQ